MSSKTSFQWPTRTGLAAAIALSLGGCSTTPDMGGYDMGGVGDTLGRIGHATADASVAAWEGAQRFFGIGIGAVPRQPRSDDGLLDEVDLALMEHGSADDAGDLVAVAQPTRLPQPLDMQPLPGSRVLSADPMAEPVARDVYRADAPAQDLAMVDNPAGSNGGEFSGGDIFVASQDYTHEVKASENLWQIAKTTTGDANNWHILADLNNLAPDASVFPGQTLVIPADLVKPELAAAPAGAPAMPAQPLESAYAELDAALEQPAGRLAIPGRSDAPMPAVADSLDAPAAPVVAVAASTLPDVDMNAARRPFALESNETLWDFAKRTTGDATNWKAIAAFNGFTEKQATQVRMGQSIDVPQDLVRPELSGATQQAKAALAAEPVPAAALPAESLPVAAAEPSTTDTAIDASGALLNGANTLSLLDETQPVKIVEANFQSAPVAVDAGQIASEAAAALASPQTVMVSGTYYPKAVYNEADFSSSLLMRVSPGTELTVSRAIGPWFEVTTDKGVGYVHSRDIK